MCQEEMMAKKEAGEQNSTRGDYLRGRPDPKTLGEQIDSQIENTTNHLAYLVKRRQEIRARGYDSFPLHLLHGDDHYPF